MKRQLLPIINYIWLAALPFSIAVSTSPKACEPDVYYLFKEEAVKKLNSLRDQDFDDSEFKKAVLLHNLAFHKDKQAREEAERLFNELKTKAADSNLLKAYRGSLKMIKISQANVSSKILKSLNPLGTSPRKEARRGFSLISEAVTAEPDNKIIRCLRATAATESAEHLAEMFDYARNDLNWLDSCLNPEDSVAVFFVNLNWAKYYYKLWRRNPTDEYYLKAAEHIKTASEYACIPAYRSWADEWEAKLLNRSK